MKATNAVIRTLIVILVALVSISSALAQKNLLKDATDIVTNPLKSFDIALGITGHVDRDGNMTVIYTEARYYDGNGRYRFSQTGRYIGVPLNEHLATMKVYHVVFTTGPNIMEHGKDKNGKDRPGTLRQDENSSTVQLGADYFKQHPDKVPSKEEMQKRLDRLEARERDRKAGRQPADDLDGTEKDPRFEIINEPGFGYVAIFHLNAPGIDEFFRPLAWNDHVSSGKNRSKTGTPVGDIQWLPAKDEWRDASGVVEFVPFWVPDLVYNDMNELFWSTSLMVGFKQTGHFTTSPLVQPLFIPTRVEDTEVYKRCVGFAGTQPIVDGQQQIDDGKGKGDGANGATNDRADALAKALGFGSDQSGKGHKDQGKEEEEKCPFEVITTEKDGCKFISIKANDNYEGTMVVTYEVTGDEHWWEQADKTQKPVACTHARYDLTAGKCSRPLQDYDCAKTLEIWVRFKSSKTGKTKTECAYSARKEDGR